MYEVFSESLVLSLISCSYPPSSRKQHVVLLAWTCKWDFIRMMHVARIDWVTGRLSAILRSLDSIHWLCQRSLQSVLSLAHDKWLTGWAGGQGNTSALEASQATTKSQSLSIHTRHTLSTSRVQLPFSGRLVGSKAQVSFRHKLWNLQDHCIHVTKHNHASIQLSSSFPLICLSAGSCICIIIHLPTNLPMYCTYSPFIPLPTYLLPIILSVYLTLTHSPPNPQCIYLTASLSSCVSIYLLTQTATR